MTRLLLPSLMLTGTLVFAQAPATQKPATSKPATAGSAAPATQKPPAPATQKPAAPATQKPATPAPATRKPAAPAARRPAQTNTRAGMAITVTDMRGMTIQGVHVDVTGPTPRMGETDGSGQINFPGLAAGVYRLRFTGDPVTAFEREITVRAGQVADVDVALSAAPPRPEAPPPAPAEAPAPPPPAAGPTGQPQTTSLYDLAEKELASRQPRREILVACSGNLRSTVVFLTTENQPQRLYEDAEVSYYVLGGEAGVQVGGQETVLAAGGYVAVPRGVPFSITRRGRNPLSLLSILSGAPCEEAK